MSLRQGSSFRCACCKGEFPYVTDGTWTEEDARKETQANFPGAPDEALTVVCDDCYEDLMRAVKG